MSSDQSCIENY